MTSISNQLLKLIDSHDEELVFSTDITFVCVNEAGEKTPIVSGEAGM